MEFKRCNRCGNFFTSQNTICCNCEPKNKFDTVNAHSFITGNPEINCVYGITGLINETPKF